MLPSKSTLVDAACWLLERFFEFLAALGMAAVIFFAILYYWTHT